MGIGSVGTSPLPIFETTFSTSGNFVIKIADACFAALILTLRLLPGNTRVSSAKSPSSRVGINSPPNCIKTIIATANNASTVLSTNLG